MQTRILLPEPDNWLEGIPYQIVCSYFDHKLKIDKLLSWYMRFGRRLDVHLSVWELLREYEVIMPRERKKNGTAANNGTNNSGGKGGGAKWIWANCRLSDEDITALEQSESSLEYLATCLVALGADGFGFKSSPVDKGESICITIFRSDFPVSGTTVGVSAFAGNIRDAICAVLYKLDTYGGGDFSGFELESNSQGAKSRFR